MEIPTGAKSQTIQDKVYVYIDRPFWNPEKKRGEHRRDYIGKIIDGQFSPNKKYLLQLQNESAVTKPGPVPTEECKRQFYGATYLLDCIGDKLGIAADLKACFPKLYQQIMSVAYFLVLEDGLSMYRFRKWALLHRHPYNGVLSSQRISDLLGAIPEASKMEFFRRQAKRRAEKEFLAFDTTSISSYSEAIKLAKYGKNKEGDDLKQINLALLYGEISRLPVYYRKLPGNTADVSTITNLLKDIDFLEMLKLNLVMDRGFYSKENINNLMKQHHKFLIGVRTSIKLVKERLETIRGDTFISWQNYHDELGLYVMSFTEQWDYHEEQPRTGAVIDEKRRVYLHYYYNDQRCADDRLSFSRMLTRLQDELKNGRHKPEHEKLYAKYFTCHETPKRGLKIEAKQEAINEAQKNFGYFVLMSNGIKDPVEAIKVYRTKDLIEKSFGNLKERLDMRRMSVASEENFEGKLFIQFVALMYLSYIKKQMDDHDLFKNYSIQTMLDDLDIIEYYQQPGKAHHLSEITGKQAALYEAMEVVIPT